MPYHGSNIEFKKVGLGFLALKAVETVCLVPLL